MYVFTWNFWKDAISRVARTFCQSLVSGLGVENFSAWNIGWGAIIGIAAGSSLVSFLMCLDRAFAITEIKIVPGAEVPKLQEAPPLEEYIEATPLRS